MALAKSLTITNRSVDELYIDPSKVIDHKKAIKTDLNNIIKDLENIKKDYTKLRDNKATKGTWYDLTKSCVSKCNAYKNNMTNDKTKLENKVDDAVQKYVLAMITNLMEAQSAVDAIKE